MPPTLHGSHLQTYQALFRHPAPHNLNWHDVRTLLNAIANVVEEPDGNLKITRNNQTLTLHPHRQKDITDMTELMQLRHFLERTELAPAPPIAGDGQHLLVVIDHREARIYRAELHGALPHRIHPFDPQGVGRYLHNVQDDSNGQRKPESAPFYNSIIKALQNADKILLFGTSTGTSSAMDHLLAELKLHHKPLADRVVGTVIVDATHLTDDQLLAKARDFYQNLPASV
jgi:hypothetical protein